MKTAICARVITTDQNCELQLRELREYVARRGSESAGEYVNTGFSAAKASRLALDRLMADAAASSIASWCGGLTGSAAPAPI
jgi:DNA invertase Pin-like site-specific DNA recombinase